MQRKALHHADLINVLSEDERQWVQHNLGLGNKTLQLPNGAPAEYLRALGQRKLPPPDSKPVIAFIGSWSIRKGILDLPPFLRRVHERLPGAQLLLLGTGPTRDQVKRDLADSAIYGNVEVIPEFDRTELPGLLSDVSAAVLPSYVEGFPLVVLELAAAGVPTVAYDVPGPRILLGEIDADLLAPVGDVEALADKMIRLLEMRHEVTSILSDRARAAASRYTWKRLAEDHLTFYLWALEQVRVGKCVDLTALGAPRNPWDSSRATSS
jgi:glycosyltransferase involved in cell wall biosynthesis